MYNCPMCGVAEYKQATQCRKLVQVVCMDCCRKCEHAFKDDVYIRYLCMYGVRSEEKKKNNIIVLKEKIKGLQKRQQELYRRGRQGNADNVAWEIAALERELRRLNGA